MSLGNSPAVQLSLKVDPAGRRPWREQGEWQIWIGWIAALVLHGGLLAALICSWPVRPMPSPPNRSSISLLLLPAAKPAGQVVLVRPKPAAVSAALPATPPVKIAARLPAPHSAPAPIPVKAARPSARTSVATVASRARVEPKVVPQQDGDGFVAATPVAGSFNQPPEYPAAAQAHGEQGDVLLSIHVLANGEADSVSITQSSGYDVLDRAAATAVWKWRFQPSTLSGQPVPSVIPYRIHFDLRSVQTSD